MCSTTAPKKSGCASCVTTQPNCCARSISRTNSKGGGFGWRLCRSRPSRLNPSYIAVYSLLKQLDLDAFSQVLSEWLVQHRRTLPIALVIDGKFVGFVTLSEHETGSPVAMIDTSQKERERCELKVAQKMIVKHADLMNTVITADALNPRRMRSYSKTKPAVGLSAHPLCCATSCYSCTRNKTSTQHCPGLSKILRQIITRLFQC